MTPGQARARFATARVARLATTGPDGAPHLVPVTFAVHGDEIVTAVDHKPKRTRDLQRLRNIEHDPRVCLLADRYDDADWDALWWARADGEARVLDAYPAGVWRLAERYPQYRDRPPEGPVISIAVTRWSGWEP